MGSLAKHRDLRENEELRKKELNMVCFLHETTPSILREMVVSSTIKTKEKNKTKPEFCQENALIIASTLFQQHKRRLYTQASPDGQY